MNRLLNAALIAICAVGLQACSNSADLETARERLLEMAKEAELVGEALARGDQEQARIHQSEAARLLRAARYIYETNHAENSDDPVVLVGYADILRQSGDFDLAAEMYARATRSFPEDPTLWLNLGKSLAALDERAYEDAQAALERTVALATDDNIRAEAYSDLATIYRRMGLFESAAENLKKTLELRPQDSTARIFLAAHQARRSRVAEASDTLDGMGQMSTDTALQLKDILGSALSDFETYRHVFPDDARNHLAYAKLMLRVERTAEAIPAIERSLALDPSNFVAWNILGSVSRQQGDSERARQAFERSLKINPDQPRTVEALKNLTMTDSSPGISFQDQVSPNSNPQ